MVSPGGVMRGVAARASGLGTCVSDIGGKDSGVLRSATKLSRSIIDK